MLCDVYVGALGAETTYAHYAHMAAAYLTLNKMGDEVVWPKRANGSLIMSGTTMKKLASTNLPGKKAPLPLVCPIAKKKKTAWKLADWTSGVAAVAGRVQKIRKARADNEQEDGMAQDDGEQDHEAMKEAATLELAQWRQSVEADRAILVAAKAKQDEVIAAQQAALAEQEAALAEQARTIERQRAAAAAAQAKNRRARDGLLCTPASSPHRRTFCLSRYACPVLSICLFACFCLAFVCWGFLCFWPGF